MIGNVLINGHYNFGHAEEHASAKPLNGDITKETLTIFNYNAEVSMKCLSNIELWINDSCTSGLLYAEQLSATRCKSCPEASRG
ncbi:hypothetical protein ACIGHN_00040 [Acidovorax sp. NPDC077693]|uniref:hypothetical protein n=1 Tax=unclassified Acidovorax TaxID=2684926 RepID=UPI0037CA1F97